MAADVVAPNHLYTAHASLPRDLLLEVGGFDERLVFGFEDAALDARLASADCHVHYHPDLSTLHDHSMTLSTWSTRMKRMGSAGYHANLQIASEPPIAPRPDGFRWTVLSAAAPFLAHDRVERIVAGAEGLRPTRTSTSAASRSQTPPSPPSTCTPTPSTANGTTPSTNHLMLDAS